MQAIVLPMTEPETEWIDGRAVPKVSPTFDHARVQFSIARALDVWAAGRGTVGTEWRFRVARSDGTRAPLVPDVAFVDADAVQGRSLDELQAPSFAPTIAVEMLSPDDHPADVAAKIAVYLSAGTRAVLVLDPASRTVVIHDASRAAVFAGDDLVRHDALPDFTLPLGLFFHEALDAPFEG